MSDTPTRTDRAATWLRPEQIQRLRTACYDEQFQPRLRQRNEAIITLLYDTGLRVGELVRLDIEHLDLDNNGLDASGLDTSTLLLPDAEQPDRQLANPSEAAIPIDPAHSLGTVRLLKSYRTNRDLETGVLFPSREQDRLTPKAVRDVVSKAAELATIHPYTPAERGDADEVSPQTLRHSMAWRHLNIEERSMDALRERLRHTARSTTRSLYAHFEPEIPDEPIASAGEDGIQERLGDSGILSDVLESIPDILYVFDTNGRMQWWNDSVPAVTGYTDAEIATMHPLEFVPDSHTPELADVLAQVVEQGTIETRESHLVTRDGTHLPYEFNAAPLTDGEGSVWGIAGSGRNTSRRTLATRTAEQERERFELFVDAVTDYAMFLLDTDGHIVTWNRGAERIKGYREAEILREHFSILYPEDAVEKGVPERLLEEAASEGRVQAEGHRVRKDGTTFWAHVTITALYDEDELRGFAKVSQDVTERRKREREIERQRDELERLNGSIRSFATSTGRSCRHPAAPRSNSPSVIV